MGHIPAQVSSLLRQLTVQLPILLGRNLVGIYLYGSLTQRAFNPKHSDVDCLVVTHRDLSKAQFGKLDAWLAQTAVSNPWATRLQMSFLLRDKVLIMDSRACLYQFGRLERCRSDGNPIIWINVLKSGKVLLGPQAETFVPEITAEILFRSLVREVGYLREEFMEKVQSEWRDVPVYRIYAVLTLCRILYSFRKGTIVSKPRAARWALRHLPKEWHEIIHKALRPDGVGRRRSILLSRIKRFIRFAETQLSMNHHVGGSSKTTGLPSRQTR